MDVSLGLQPHEPACPAALSRIPITGGNINKQMGLLQTRTWSLCLFAWRKRRPSFVVVTKHIYA